MKLTTTILPLAALSTAFVIPDEQLTNQILVESKPKSFLESLTDKTNDVFSEVKDSVIDFTENAFDSAMNAAIATKEHFSESLTAFDGQGWLDSALTSAGDLDLFNLEHGKHGKHGHHGHHGHHGCHKPNQTVYQLIAESKYTTKLAKAINEFPDLVDALNGTAANYTVFAPTDKAIDNYDKHHKGEKKPSKEEIKAVLAYHVSPEFYPAGRVLVTHTVPTTYGEERIGGRPQRLRLGLGLRGLAVNFYARIIAVNIFGTNGVIHGIDHVLMPPPQASKVLELLPGEFSTLTLGLAKTGLFEELADKEHHHGGTLFAPSNWAFQKLGPKINMFLFSEHGKKYLKALLKYHIAPDQTLYSDEFYPCPKDDDHEDVEGIPKGKFHIDLQTMLEDKSLSVDIIRFGGLISMKVNGFADVSLQDGIVKDGVIQEMSSVLIPPKMPGGKAVEAEAEGEMTVEELVDRLQPYCQEL